MKENTPHDEDMLLDRINKRDPIAFSAAYDEYAPRIFRHAYFRVNSKELAEDITSEVFTKTWDWLGGKGNTIKNLKTFLYTLATRLIIDHWRRKPREPLLLDEYFEKWLRIEKDIIRELIQEEELKEVLEGLQHLTQEKRDVLTLRYIEGLSFEEIADIIGKSKNAVYIILSRGVKELKDIISS